MTRRARPARQRAARRRSRASRQRRRPPPAATLGLERPGHTMKAARQKKGVCVCSGGEGAGGRDGRVSGQHECGHARACVCALTRRSHTCAASCGVCAVVSGASGGGTGGRHLYAVSVILSVPSGAAARRVSVLRPPAVARVTRTPRGTRSVTPPSAAPTFTPLRKAWRAPTFTVYASSVVPARTAYSGSPAVSARA